MTQLVTLEERVQLQEDLEEIKNLKRLHGFYANVLPGDIGRIDQFAALFTADAEYDVGLGFAAGPQQIADQMRNRRTAASYSETISVAMHFYLTPHIEVHGNEATGRWCGLFPFILQGQARPVWMANMYEEKYRRTAEGWRFQAIKTAAVFEPLEFHTVYEAFISEGVYGSDL